MAPPMTLPSERSWRYIWPREHSVNLEAMPRTPARIIQKVAPGPPIEMAMATPAMLPSPTVAERAAVRASKWETSPSSSGSSYLPRVTWIACQTSLN